MNIQVNRVFLKELAKVPAKERLKVEKLLFEEVENYISLAQIPNFKKLKGYRNYYKIIESAANKNCQHPASSFLFF